MILGYQTDKDIKLKILEEGEAGQLFKLVDSNHKYLTEFLLFVEYTKRTEDSKHLVHSVSQRFIGGSRFYCGIWGDKELIGVIGLRYPDSTNKHTSIGYYLAENSQKKGIMARYTKALIQYIYEEYDINRVEIRMSTKNKKNQAISIRPGFTQGGILRSDGCLQREFSDSYVYDLLRGKYKNEYK